ncbi:beta-2-glycoprotein 1 isoform X2 [Megalopta genalis]|uniref:beta-2-glycoprotein 1 isoform X2 n=1 Tax=Megalopta genalis TaxID=115081 RepID=UPI00144379CE|nr:modular serine protease-like isoform X2 [Megalopta genalis]
MGKVGIVGEFKYSNTINFFCLDTFRCKNGECIESTLLCDGRPDCRDKSDETTAECSKRGIICPYTTFRCGYGACVDGDSTCNGVINCIDGSDENPTLCRTISSPTNYPEPPATSMVTDTVTSYVPSVTCKTPPQPRNGDWKLHESQCQSGEHCHVGQDFQFQKGTHLVYSCNRGFKIKGSTDVFCSIHGVWYKIPECEEVYCTNLNSASVVADCKYPGRDYVSCDSSRPGTISTLKYRDGYDGRTLSLPTTVKCSDNGEWIPQPLGCDSGPLINIFINWTSHGVITHKAENNFIGIERLNDKIIIYQNKEELFKPDIDVRSLA